MKSLLKISLVTAFCLMNVAEANTVIYTPPAKAGTVYVVVNYKFGSIGTTQKTNANINWAGWSKSDTISPSTIANGCNYIKNSGFVIQLTHSKNDSYAITATSDGTVVSVAQGNAPSQWNNQCYKRVSW